MGKHSKPTNPTIRQLVAASVIVPAGLGLATAFAAPAWADQPAATGQNDATEPKDTGAPNQAVGTVSQFSHAFNSINQNSDEVKGGLGAQHTSNFAPGQSPTKPENGGATGRLGVGNVARIDSSFGASPQFDEDTPNSHFAGQTTMDGISTTDPSLPPGNNDNPNRGNPNAP